MPCGWEGNRRTALAMSHSLQMFIHALTAKEREISTPPTLRTEYSTPFPFYFSRRMQI